MIRVCLVVLMCLAGCAASPRRDRGAPAPPAVDKVRDLGPLDFLKVVRARDGGYSTRLRNGSVWVFGDSILQSPGQDGSRWRSSTWCRTEDLDASDGLAGLTEPLDARGAPREFLPFTSEEQAYNDLHFKQSVPETKRTRWALWPGPVVVDPEGGKTLVFFGKIFGRSGGMFDFDVKGHSIATWDGPGSRPVRHEVRRGSEDPTLLFPAGDVVLGQGALLKDGWLYAYGCQTKNLTWPCIVARARFADALDRR
ncbi:MAG: DUF4185 domain-containing protein, partial [Planctomycetota bacterium]